LLDRYIEKMKGEKYFETSIKYFTGNNETGEQEIKGVLRDHFAGKMLSETDYKALEDFRDKRKKTPTQYETPRSERTVDLEMAILRRMFKKGVLWGMIEKNPFENSEDLFYKARNKRERPLTGDEVKRLVEAWPPYLKGIVIKGIYTGLRKGDILNLKWQNIDLEKGMIRLIEAKTKKTRVIVLNEDMKKLLQILPVKGEYLFPNKHGKPFRDIKRSFETALKEAGIKQGTTRRDKIAFHSLRHTCISLLQEKGADTTAVRNYVEHASDEMTRQYTHVTEEYARRTASILDGICGVDSLDRNKMETIGKKSKTSQNTSLASA
jgi:integrase